MNDDANRCFGSSVLCTSYFTLFSYTYVKVREGAQNSESTRIRATTFPLAPCYSLDTSQGARLATIHDFTGRHFIQLDSIASVAVGVLLLAELLKRCLWPLIAIHHHQHFIAEHFYYKNFYFHNLFLLNISKLFLES